MPRAAQSAADSGSSDHTHRDAQLRALAQSHATLVDQFAEILDGQNQATERAGRASERMGLIEGKLEENTNMTAELLDIIQAVKGGFRVLGWLGIAGKWIGGIAAGIVAVYSMAQLFLHFGQPTK